jgi:hypothetical protein
MSYDHPFCAISQKFPSLKIFVWCNEEHDVIETIAEKQEECANAIKELSKISEIVDILSDQHKVQLITRKCRCKQEKWMGSGLGSFNLVYLSPIIYEQSWEYARIIAFRHEDIKRFLQRLEERGFIVEILRKVPFDGLLASALTLTADALFSDLTEKQIDAILSSFNFGYYRLPRKADIKTIASKMKVPRTTFQEHLKKGQNKLIVSLVPYLRLFKQSTTKRKELH